MYQHILVPIDGSPTAQRGLREAIAMARITGGRLRLIHVIDEWSRARARSAIDGYTPDWLDAVRRTGAKLLEDAAALARDEGIDCETLLRDSFSLHLAEVVADEADRLGIDLIVLGTHGRRGIGRFLMGSGAESILRLAKVPVLLVRAVEPAKALEQEEPIKVSLPTGALAYE